MNTNLKDVFVWQTATMCIKFINLSIQRISPLFPPKMEQKNSARDCSNNVCVIDTKWDFTKICWLGIKYSLSKIPYLNNEKPEN